MTLAFLPFCKLPVKICHLEILLKDGDEVSPTHLALDCCHTHSIGSPAPKTAYRSPIPEGAQTIDVTAKKYEFAPSTIRVKQGTRVQLKIRAIDHAHGFKISEMPDSVDTKGNPGLVFASAQECTKIEEGKSETVEFVAQSSGRYPFRCCVHCGWHYRGMKGELIVEP